MSQDLKDYINNSVPIRVSLDDIVLHAARKTFFSGSRGWHYSGKVQILVGTTYYTVQVGLCMTIVGSKNPSLATNASSSPMETPMAIYGPVEPLVADTHLPGPPSVPEVQIKPPRKPPKRKGGE